jgi:VWFA-related protein
MTRARHLLALASIALLAMAPQERADGQRPTFTTGTEAVLVDVLVTARGRPVTDLTAADFTVRANGEPQRVELLDSAGLPQNLFLVVDTGSDNVARHFEAFSGSVGAVLKNLDARDRVALLSFSHRAHLLSPLTTDRAAILRHFVAAPPDRHSALADALFATSLVSRDEPGRSVALVFTQAEDSASWLTDDEVLAAARRSNLLVYGVTLRRPPGQRIRGHSISMSGGRGMTIREEFDRTYSARFDGSGDVLARVAEATGGRVIAGDTARLDEVLSAILDEFRARYVLAFRPEAPPAGWHELSVRVARRDVTVSARQGYFVAQEAR